MKRPTSRIVHLTTASALTSLLSLATSSRAEDYTWTGAANTVWNTTSANWSGGGSTWVNGSGNNAIFGALTNATLSLGENITLGTLSTTGGNTVNFTGGAGTSIDVTNISTAGTGNGSIDMSKVLTGSHDLNYSSTATGSGGRLNLKVAANYTGNTNLSGTAYLLIDGSADNILPTATIVSLGSGTILRMAKAGTQLLTISGLTGAGTFASQAGAAQQHNLVINTSSANAIQSFTGALNNSTSTLNIRLTGTGTQTIAGSAKTYSGTTRVSGGTLILGTNLTNTSSVTVDGGVLASTAATTVSLGVGAFSMSSGEISAGGNAAAGTFALAANQSFSTTGGKLTFNIGTESDRISGSGTGTFNIGSGTELALILGSGFSYGSTYNLISGFSSGSITGLSITGYDTANYTASLSNAGVLSFTATAIPEPSTFATLAGATLFVFASLRRRRA